MRQMQKRVENLETRIMPAELRDVHIIGMVLGEGQAAAIARYGHPIAEGDEIIWLVPGMRDEAA